MPENQTVQEQLAEARAKLDGFQAAFDKALDDRMIAAGLGGFGSPASAAPAPAPAPAAPAASATPAESTGYDPFTSRGRVPTPAEFASLSSAEVDLIDQVRSLPSDAPTADIVQLQVKWETTHREASERREAERVFAEREAEMENPVAQVRELARRQRDAFIGEARGLGPVQLLNAAKDAGVLELTTEQMVAAGVPSDVRSRISSARSKLVPVRETWGQGDVVIGDVNLAYPSSVEKAEAIEAHRAGD